MTKQQKTIMKKARTIMRFLGGFPPQKELEQPSDDQQSSLRDGLSFDAAWYVATYGDSFASNEQPLQHYETIGWKKGFNPTPLFDVTWYLKRYTDVADAGLEPYKHFIEHGLAEGRNPTALFDAQWYLDNYPDVQAVGCNPYSHFMEHGWREGRNPGPDFDTQWYLSEYSDVAQEGVNPYLHYLEYGIKEGRFPCRPLKQDKISVDALEWFDAEWYAKQYPEVWDSELTPYEHFVTIGWHAGYNPHPLFDTRWYLEHVGNPENKNPIDLLVAQTVTEHEKGARNANFDWPLAQKKYGGASGLLPVAYSPPDRVYFDSDSEAEFEKKLQAADIVSFDIFDTALFRNVELPISVFEIWDNRFASRFPDLQHRLCDIRFCAEREAREIQYAKNKTYEIMIDDIFDVIKEELGIDDVAKDMLMRGEMQVEREVLRANPQVLAWSRKAEAAGKKVIFVSDMYLPADFLRSVLEAQGYYKPEVYVSGEHLSSKGDKKLFGIVENKIQTPGTRILHIGDNFVSDKKHPEECGWSAVHYKKESHYLPFARQLVKNPLTHAANLTTSIALGLSHTHRAKISSSTMEWKQKLAQNIGYELLGPIVLGFTGWVIEQAKKTSSDKVMFLARDGLLPFEVFKRIAKDRELETDACYVAASRRLLYNTQFSTKEDVEKFVKAGNFIIGTTLAVYMDMFNLREEDYMPVAREYGFTSPQDTIFDGSNYGPNYHVGLEKLIKIMDILTDKVIEESQKNRKTLVGYYKKEVGDVGCGNISIIDLGWSGTLVAPLSDLLKSYNGKLKFSAFFFGLTAHANIVMPDTLPTKGYFFDRDQWTGARVPLDVPGPKEKIRIIEASPSLLEILISANHTTVIKIEENEGGFSKIHAQDTYSVEQREFLTEAHKACMEFVEDALALLPDDIGTWNFNDVITHGWNRLLSSPSEDEAQLLGAFPHRVEASGLGADTTLVLPVKNSADVDVMWDEYTYGAWPAGWFACLNDRARASFLTKV